jgi:hypothetical protein
MKEKDKPVQEPEITVSGNEAVSENESLSIKEPALPEIGRHIDLQKISEERQRNDHLVKLQKFVKLVNMAVEADKLQPHPIVKGVQYLPISFMEMTLDELYFGLWKTDNFRWSQVANELVGTLELHVFNPIAQVWLTRTGAAAVQIMVDAIPKEQKEEMTRKEINGWAIDLSNKKPSALSNGSFAALKADCFKNACLSLGKYFGRDVNRVAVDEYTPVVKPLNKEIEKYRMELSEAIDMCQDNELRSSVIETILQAEADGTNTPELYRELISRFKSDQNGK